MHIRDARPSDVDSIIALDYLAKMHLDRVDFIAHAVTSRTCLVAESLERVVGYGVLEDSFFSHGFISMVYVANADRRKGVGSALFKALADRCTTGKLFTSTNESNHAMQSLLVKSGFLPSGVIYNLDPGDPEQVYFKPRQSP